MFSRNWDLLATLYFVIFSPFHCQRSLSKLIAHKHPVVVCEIARKNISPPCQNLPYRALYSFSRVINNFNMHRRDLCQTNQTHTRLLCSWCAPSNFYWECFDLADKSAKWNNQQIYSSIGASRLPSHLKSEKTGECHHVSSNWNLYTQYTSRLNSTTGGRLALQRRIAECWYK